MKLLYILNIANRVNNFSNACMVAAKDLNIEFHIAGNWGYKNINEREADEKKYGIKIHQIDFERNPLSPRNICAYKQLNKLMQSEKYDVVHSNTPVGGLIGRICARKNNVPKVLYQAHGFHFYKGAPLKNWLLFYPAEKLCAHFTDTLITINQEDYNLARKKMKAKSIEYVPGVGVDTSKFANVEIDRDKKRQELDIPVDKKLLISIGELNENKNHETVIRALQDIKDVCYIIVGKGDKQQMLEKLIDDLDVSDRVFLLGYRQDIGELLKMSDLFAFPSYREGLSVSVMETMSSGLPVVCSNIRGNCDLIDENGGVLFDPHSIDDCKNAITKALNSNMADMGKCNQVKVSNFSYEKVHNKMKEIYKCLKAEL